jgi:HAD superfamily hydrolase (TIGR01509 family)
MMARAALDKYLEFTISNEDVARAKPDPEIYNLAIGRFGIAPSECLIIEDNDHGIRAAQAAGAHVLAVDDVNEVTLANIVRRIAECDVAAAAD